MKKDKHSAIYSISHPASKSVYVGSSVDVERRWRSHRKDLELQRHRCQHLQRAWIKYGGDGFVFDILEDCQPVKEQLLALEQHWMDYYKSTGLYNTCPIAGSPLGLKLTIEQRGKISNAQKGKKKSESHRYALSLAALQRVRSEEELAGFASYWTGKKKSPEHLQKIGESVSKTIAGRSEQQRAEISLAQSLAHGHHCTINGVFYPSVKAAAKALDISPYLVRVRYLR
jgi:group I intron endonuclease